MSEPPFMPELHPTRTDRNQDVVEDDEANQKKLYVLTLSAFILLYPCKKASEVKSRHLCNRDKQDNGG